MYATSRPTTPFIPPYPGASPANIPPVIPPTPGNAPYVVGGWPPPAPPGAGPPVVPPWPGTPYSQRGRRNSYNGMPVGSPPFDPGTYFGYPAAAYPTATPAAAAPPVLLAGDPWAGQQDYLSAHYGQQAPVIPPRPSRSHSRSHSRGSHSGFPPDWVGPMRPDEPFAMPPQAVPPQFAAAATPWYNPMMMPGTQYSAFQYPLPPVGYPPPPPAGHRPSRSNHTTPWHAGGYLPTTPVAETDGLRDPFDQAARPSAGSGMVDTRWFTGKDYGPVLDPLLAGITRCSFKINPLLAPAPDDPTNRPYLTWNMLFSSAYVHRSDERPNQSWMKGRDAPATFPRLSAMRIVSRSFSWFIDVRAHSRSMGVTCGDVIDTVSAFLLKRTGERDYNALSDAQKSRVAQAYHHNRSMAEDVPGGRLGEGMRRCDFLGEMTMWGGLGVDPVYVTERMSISGRAKREANNIFVLGCESRLPLTAEERRDQAARGAQARSRAASTSE